MNHENDEKFTKLFKFSHKKEICCLSFTVGKGKYANPLLASVCQNGQLIVWNLDKREKLLEDDKLKKSSDYSKDRFRFHTVLFMDDQFDFNERLEEKTEIDSLNFLRSLSNAPRDANYFQLLVTNSNGYLQEYKVPKYLTNVTFKAMPSNFKIMQSKFTKIFSILTPRSFQTNLKDKVKKGDHHRLTNNNNYPIMIQITQKNACFHFAVLDLLFKKQVQTIPLLANALTNIDFNPVNQSLIAIPDCNGFLTWNLPNFDNKYAIVNYFNLF